MLPSDRNIAQARTFTDMNLMHLEHGCAISRMRSMNGCDKDQEHPLHEHDKDLARSLHGSCMIHAQTKTKEISATEIMR